MLCASVASAGRHSSHMLPNLTGPPAISWLRISRPSDRKPKLISSVSGPFQPFGGAVDIIVVQQPDGSLKSSPWYVRFGNFQGVLKRRERVVSIIVNEVEVDLHMFLDTNGEAFFLRHNPSDAGSADDDEEEEDGEEEEEEDGEEEEEEDEEEDEGEEGSAGSEGGEEEEMEMEGQGQSEPQQRKGAATADTTGLTGKKKAKAKGTGGRRKGAGAGGRLKVDVREIELLEQEELAMARAAGVEPELLKMMAEANRKILTDAKSPYRVVRSGKKSGGFKAGAAGAAGGNRDGSPGGSRALSHTLSEPEHPSSTGSLPSLGRTRDGASLSRQLFRSHSQSDLIDTPEPAASSAVPRGDGDGPQATGLAGSERGGDGDDASSSQVLSQLAASHVDPSLNVTPPRPRAGALPAGAASALASVGGGVSPVPGSLSRSRLKQSRSAGSSNELADPMLEGGRAAAASSASDLALGINATAAQLASATQAAVSSGAGKSVRSMGASASATFVGMVASSSAGSLADHSDLDLPLPPPALAPASAPASVSSSTQDLALVVARAGSAGSGAGAVPAQKGAGESGGTAGEENEGESEGRDEADTDPVLREGREREKRWRQVVTQAAEVIKDAPWACEGEYADMQRRKEESARQQGAAAGGRRSWSWFSWRSRQHKAAAAAAAAASDGGSGAGEGGAGGGKGEDGASGDAGRGGGDVGTRQRAGRTRVVEFEIGDGEGSGEAGGKGGEDKRRDRGERSSGGDGVREKGAGTRASGREQAEEEERGGHEGDGRGSAGQGGEAASAELIEELFERKWAEESQLRRRKGGQGGASRASGVGAGGQERGAKGEDGEEESGEEEGGGEEGRRVSFASVERGGSGSSSSASLHSLSPVELSRTNSSDAHALPAHAAHADDTAAGAGAAAERGADERGGQADGEGAEEGEGGKRDAWRRALSENQRFYSFKQSPSLSGAAVEGTGDREDAQVGRDEADREEAEQTRGEQETEKEEDVAREVGEQREKVEAEVTPAVEVANGTVTRVCVEPGEVDGMDGRESGHSSQLLLAPISHGDSNERGGHASECDSIDRDGKEGHEGHGEGVECEGKGLVQGEGRNGELKEGDEAEVEEREEDGEEEGAGSGKSVVGGKKKRRKRRGKKGKGEKEEESMGERSTEEEECEKVGEAGEGSSGGGAESREGVSSAEAGEAHEIGEQVEGRDTGSGEVVGEGERGEEGVAGAAVDVRAAGSGASDGAGDGEVAGTGSKVQERAREVQEEGLQEGSGEGDSGGSDEHGGGVKARREEGEMGAGESGPETVGSSYKGVVVEGRDDSARACDSSAGPGAGAVGGALVSEGCVEKGGKEGGKEENAKGDGEEESAEVGGGEESAKEEGAKEEGAKEEGAKEEGVKEEGVKEEGVKEEGVKEEGVKEEGVKEEGVKEEGLEEGTRLTEGEEHGEGHVSDMHEKAFEDGVLAVCRHLLFPKMGSDAAATVFNAAKITWHQFRCNAPSILSNDRLVVRVGDRLAPVAIRGRRGGAGAAVGAAGMAAKVMSGGAVQADVMLAAAAAANVAIHMERNKGGGGGGAASAAAAAAAVRFAQPGLLRGGQQAQLLLRERENEFYERATHVRSLTPTSEQLKALGLKEGKNRVQLTFTTRMWGRQEVQCSLFVWRWNTRVVISDVDGTITKSDVLGQVMPLMGADWTQIGVARLFTAIRANGYELLFLSARAIQQAALTRSFLFSLRQDGEFSLPEGPVVISPDGLFPSLYREVIRRAPHEFKIACLSDIRALFPAEVNPFYAGFGNRDTDAVSYEAMGIARGKIFTINPKGEVTVNKVLSAKSYVSLHDLVHDIFPAFALTTPQGPEPSLTRTSRNSSPSALPLAAADHHSTVTLTRVPPTAQPIRCQLH
ncbi:unnamed protein product [Closterium sp. Yama58-4]|nr:unnamed protein product [Closterium sp. Yama58-4]